jgi:uncharacterized protein YjiS (DUF1127 family)
MQMLHSSVELKKDCACAAFAYLCLKRTETHIFEQSGQMAYETNSIDGGTGVMTRISALVTDYRANAARRKIYRETLRELSALSARDLNDLGLNRSEIRRVAYQAAYEA